MSKRLYLSIGMLLASGGLWGGFKLMPTLAEFVSGRFIEPVSIHLARLSSSLPYPLMECLIGVLLIWFGIELIRTTFLCFKTKTLDRISGFIQSVSLVLSALVLSYVALWAPLYVASPLESQMGLSSDGQYPLSELTELTGDLTIQANALRESLSSPLPPYEFDELAERVVLAMRGVEGFEAKTLSPVKTFRYPEMFRSLGIAGMYFPWTGEAVVSNQELPLSLPFMAAHESAHQVGYAREDEANLIAYLACMQGDDYFQYSGSMYALYYAMEALHDADTICWTEQRLQMSKAVQSDYYRMNGLRNAPENPFMQFRTRATMAFEQITKQEGYRSYGDVVNLLLELRRIGS